MNATLVKWSLSLVLVAAAAPALAADPLPPCKDLPKNVQTMIRDFDVCAREGDPAQACLKFKLNARVYDNAQGLLPPLGGIGAQYWRASPALLGSPQGLVYNLAVGAKGKPISKRYYTGDNFKAFCEIAGK